MNLSPDESENLVVAMVSHYDWASNPKYHNWESTVISLSYPAGPENYFYPILSWKCVGVQHLRGWKFLKLKVVFNVKVSIFPIELLTFDKWDLGLQQL